MRVAICVITYKRPQGLARLLDGLDKLIFDGDEPNIEVVAVDNDAERSGAEVCGQRKPSYRWKLTYHVEPQRGIPFARNTAVNQAAPNADFIAFIDDDELPEPNWLNELLRVQREYDADVVAGPVVSRFEGDIAPWIGKGRFFERRRHPTGQILDRAYTGNVLFRTEMLRTLPTLFDERMALTGGSDTHFFRRVARAGYKIVWADEAVVTDWLPASRITARWILQRGFRMGTSKVLIDMDLRPWPIALPFLTSIGIYRISTGALLALPGLLIGKHFFMRQVRYVCYGAGLLAGLAGVRYKEYRTTHGS
jgi:succinoglycan biosynthesis protein ExoM